MIIFSIVFQDKGFMEDHDFPNFGGDIETLLLNIKIVHGQLQFKIDGLISTAGGAIQPCVM